MNATVFDINSAMCIIGNFLFVCNQYDGIPFALELIEKRHDLVASR